MGIEDFVGDRGSCEFIVEGLKEGEWRELYRSPVKRGGEPSLTIKADVTGCAKLRLKTTVGRDNPNADHAVWADALLE